jgi:spore protease
VPTVVDAATLVNDTLDLVIGQMVEEARGSDNEQFYNMLSNLREEEKYSLITDVLHCSSGNMFVTPKEVDEVVTCLSAIIANALNISLHKGITKNDINKYMY